MPGCCSGAWEHTGLHTLECLLNGLRGLLLKAGDGAQRSEVSNMVTLAAWRKKVQKPLCYVAETRWQHTGPDRGVWCREHRDNRLA
jgi:hypothetical protein